MSRRGVSRIFFVSSLALAAGACDKVQYGECADMAVNLCVKVNQGTLNAPPAVLQLELHHTSKLHILADTPPGAGLFVGRKHYAFEVGLEQLTEGGSIDISVTARNAAGEPVGRAAHTWSSAEDKLVQLGLVEACGALTDCPSKEGQQLRCCGDACVDVNSDPVHCGRCDNRCPCTNCAADCSGGTCTTIKCLEGFSDCDGDKSNGCEVNRTEDEQNCGKCNVDCGTAPCYEGQCAKRVFVTSQPFFNGNLGGLQGADVKCKSRAGESPILRPSVVKGADFKAWLSDANEEAGTRLTWSADAWYVLVDGTKIAKGGGELRTEKHAQLMTLDEKGNPAPGVAAVCGAPGSISLVWTFTKYDGTRVGGSQHCGNWRDPGLSGTWGAPKDPMPGKWSFFCSGAAGSCAVGGSLLCIEQ